MIDWLTMTAQLTHSERLFSGRMVIINADGQVTFEREQGLQVEGSHEAHVMIWSQPDAMGGEGRYVRVSGCPAKFHQGHNVFGSDDLPGVARAMLHGVSSRLGLAPTFDDYCQWERGNIGLSMVDVNQSWKLASRDQVRSALQSMEQFGRLKHRGGAEVDLVTARRGSLTRGGTVYWGKHSRRWALKAYAKGDELAARKKGHRLPTSLSMVSELEAFADCLLRIELRLLGLELAHRSLDTVWDWDQETAARLHSEAMAKLEISEAAMLKPAQLEGLSPRLVLAYQSWVAGHDLRELLPRRTFYRYRAELLAVGIDIALKRPGAAESNVIPLRLVLHAYPVSVPEFARNTPLYFEPRAA